MPFYKGIFLKIRKGKSVKEKLLTLLLITFICISANKPLDQSSNLQQDISEEEEKWVNSIYDNMTLDERVGQLFSIRAHSDKGKEHTDWVAKQIKDFHVGGLVFFQGTPEKQAELTNQYQSIAKIPLMVAVDAEWGLGMRFRKSAISFPRQLTLGAIQDNRLLYEMGIEVARQCQRLGIHVNFAPVVDVNNNPNNPVINTRSFGEDRYNVAAKSYMYMKGMQDGNIMACAKHFPGHGDTDVDSHLDLPVIAHDNARLDSIELFPFKVLAQHGIQSMMIAHLHVPSIDATPNLPTTLSTNAIRDLLKKEIGFEGLIFTDALEMKGVTKHHGPGEVSAKSLIAGNDVLELPDDIEKSINAIKQYLSDGRITEARIEESVKKILRAKYRMGFNKTPTPIKVENIRAELNSPKATVLKRKLIQNSMTLVRNPKDLIPFKNIENTSFASVSLGVKSDSEFQKTISFYKNMTHFTAPKKISESKQNQIIKAVQDKDVVFVSLHDLSSYAKKGFGITTEEKRFIQNLRLKTKVVLVHFGNPYALKYFDNVDYVLQAYAEDDETQEIAAQALFGAFAIDGRLPVTASEKSKFNTGVATQSLLRMGYDIPAAVGMDATKLAEIDGLVKEAMDLRATPGGVVLVAKDGKIVYNKAYGHHTYDKKRKVKTTDIYDLASITKIAASTISMMKLYEEGHVNIYNPMSDYIPELKGTNKEHTTVQDMMAHRAQLTPWIPFFEQTVSKSKRPLPEYYSKKQSDKYNIPVTDKLFMKEDFTEEMWLQIYHSELLSTRKYRYSDLAFYLVADAVEKVKKQPLDVYADQTFYKKLGLHTTTYRPLEKFSRSAIPPTEDDKYFRRARVHGHVHDMGAAMLGGVSGHAGLFSNANDLAVIMQMLLNEGYYGGEQFFSPSTVRTFTTRHNECTRRGIGFDMKELDLNRSQNMSEKASANAFGHLGFTGTCVWADPDQNLIYIFLTNRTFPSMRRNKWGGEDFRPRIQSIIYDALNDGI